MVAKSKKDQPCYTRKTKTGKSYVTCEGAQKREQNSQSISKIYYLINQMIN